MTRVPSEKRRPAVFLDRDGTIMRDADYCSDPNMVEVFAGVPDGLRRLKQAGYKLFVITNQSGIGRGYFTEEQYRAVESELSRQLGADLLDATYFCPDKPETGSRRRKPSPEMIFEAAREHDIDLSRSYFIGDKSIDIKCGQNAGVRTILVQTGYGAREHTSSSDWIARDLNEAVEIILRRGQ